MYELLIGAGVLCLLVWLGLLFKRHPRPLHEEIRAMERYQPGVRLPVELDPAELRRNLNRYAGNQSALQVYVTSLRERFEVSVGMKVIEQKIRETDVKRELLDKVYELLKVEGRLQRLPQEEELEQQKLRTQLLEEKTRQGQLEDDIENQRDIRKLTGSLEKKKLQKQLADFDKDAAELQKPPDPIKEHREKARVKTELKKIDLEEDQKLKKAQREAENALEGEMETELREARKEGYPEAWESEGKWIENLETKREKLTTYVDLIIDTYEQKKQRVLQKYGIK